MNDDELLKMAGEAEEQACGMFVRRRRSMEDFRYDERQEKFWDTTTGELLGAKSVDGAIPKSSWPTREGAKGQLKPYAPSIAINDVETGLTVEGSTWWPGQPRFIHDVIINERGLMKKKGAACYNTYCAPDRSDLKTSHNPDLWIEHVKFLFPDPLEHEHFFDFAAHMLQRPDEKVNHGIVIAGAQGIGKDTALAPLRMGVGEHNTAEVEPDAITSQYNGYVKSVLLVINEVRPHDEDHKASSFYNQLKPLLASPPEMLPMELKYANVIYIRNLCHVVLTTNDPLTMYIPSEDRRLFVMTSPLPDPKKTPIFAPDYFTKIHDYLSAGGSHAVIRWLLNRPLSGFNPCLPPPATAGKKAIIDSAHQVRRTFADDIYEYFVQKLFPEKPPEVLFTRDLFDFVNASDLFDDRQEAIKMLSAKTFHFKMNERGYDAVRNPYTVEWCNGKFRSRMAYVAKSVPFADQVKAVEAALRVRPLALNFVQ